MRTKLANINDCAVPFLSRAAANSCWYYYNTNANDYCSTSTTWQWRRLKRVPHSHLD